jgi:predicted DNA-binding transcriptional regulator AlpA
MSANTQTDRPTRRLVDAREAGRILGCSWRTVYRLADRGAIPTGVKLGALRRWDAFELTDFIANGCKPPKPARARA